MPKKPAENVRSTPFNMRVRPAIKAAAEQMAADDRRSVASWIELLIEAEAERRAAANKG
ncbi:hypothetical protein ACVSQB_33035 [Bradyrhizobium elkanii]